MLAKIRRVPGLSEDEKYLFARSLAATPDERWRTFERYESVYTFGSHGEVRPWKLFLLEQLGLVQLQELPQSHASRKIGNVSGWLMGGARLTNWGTAVTWALLQLASPQTNGGQMSPRSIAGLVFDMLAAAKDHGRPESAAASRHPAGDDAAEDGAGDAEAMLEEEPEEPGEEAGFGTLQPMFQPYFPEWQKVYGPPKGEERTGTHIFKVSITGMHGNSRAWRRLAAPPGASLEALAYAILDAYDFDSDHLWDFRFRDQRGKNHQYSSSEGDSEGPSADEISVAETGLALNGAMIFTFDYGDNWEFKVVLEEVEPGPSRLKHPKVVASAGKAPEQYPDWDE